jgi:Na+/H+ antiporter NhaD/arsenite permease-like protein
MKTLAVGLFILAYTLLLTFSKARAQIALAVACLYLIFGIVPFGEWFSVIDWNVVMMITGTMGIVALFIESKMPSRLADLIISKMPTVKWATISLVVFAGFVSAFIDNVATVLMIAPVAIDIAKKLKKSPVPMVIGIAVSSNLQGAATLVGDTTSILLGGYANLNFFDFFIFKGKMGLFWIVQIGALAATLVGWYLFRDQNQKISSKGLTEVKEYFPSVLMISMVLMLVVASFIPEKPAITNGLIAMGLMVIGAIWKTCKVRNIEGVKSIIQGVDLPTILLLIGIFTMVGGLTNTGVVEDLAHWIVSLGSSNKFIIFTILVWVSVFFSAFIDNIPYVAAMLPVIERISGVLSIQPYVFYFGLIIGATLGGNLTPIGASANVTALGILRKAGFNVDTLEFMRIGVPFSLAAVTTGYILVWLIWA